MPCVCLRNTFKHWQSLKEAELAKVKAQPAPIQPDLKVAERGIFSDEKVLKAPHTRRPRRLARPKYSVTPELNFRRSSPRVTRADLINAESKLGSTIFGPIPAGHRREFFHDQQNIWIWHEDWYDGRNNPHQMTVRYEVRTSGVYKKISTGKYLKLEGDELDNFRKATHAYLYVIKKHLYNKNQPSTSNTSR